MAEVHDVRKVVGILLGITVGAWVGANVVIPWLLGILSYPLIFMIAQWYQPLMAVSVACGVLLVAFVVNDYLQQRESGGPG